MFAYLWGYVGLNEIQAYHNAWWQIIWMPALFPAGLVHTDARELDYISDFLRVYGTFIQTN